MLLLGRYYCWLLLLLINAATAKVLVFQQQQLLLSIAVANLERISNNAVTGQVSNSNAQQ